MGRSCKRKRRSPTSLGHRPNAELDGGRCGAPRKRRRLDHSSSGACFTRFAVLPSPRLAAVPKLYAAVGGASRRLQAAETELDPTSELSLLQACGLKVAWPRGSSKSSSSEAIAPPSAVVEPPAGSSASLRAMPGDTVVAPATPEVESVSSAAALEDLESLYACGIPVVWPRGHGACSASRRAGT